MEKLYTIKETADIFGVSHHAVRGTIKKHPELFKHKKGAWWHLTSAEVRRIAELRGVQVHLPSDDDADPTTPSTEIPASENACIMSEQEMSPADMMIAIHHRIEDDVNFKTYMRLSKLYESITEPELQVLFQPILERFKFSYICREVKGLQSQTLTCIARGKLRGLEKYQLTFECFLNLIKFAADNGVELNWLNKQ